MRPAYLVLDALLVVVLLVAVALLVTFWLPVALLVLVAGVSLWLVRNYHLDYLDDPDPPRGR